MCLCVWWARNRTCLETITIPGMVRNLESSVQWVCGMFVYNCDGDPLKVNSTSLNWDREENWPTERTSWVFFCLFVSNTSENTCFWSNTLYNTFKPLRNVTEEQHFRNKFSLFFFVVYFTRLICISLLKKSFWVRWMVLRMIKTR